jgi:hypothetical protein
VVDVATKREMRLHEEIGCKGKCFFRMLQIQLGLFCAAWRKPRERCRILSRHAMLRAEIAENVRFFA